MIPLLDLSRMHQDIRGELDAAWGLTVESNAYIGVTAFEQEMADYIGTEFCVSCASGTDALTLILMAMGIGKGDEVITTPYSFFATVESIITVGAMPVFADISPDYNIDSVRVAEAITERTAAIMPVHLFGKPCDMDSLNAFGIPVIEDACQAIGSGAGKWGVAAAFSFFPSKNLGCFGDGGCITTDDPNLAARARLFANHGSMRKYIHSAFGMNSRLDSLQARILSVKLPHLDEWNALRQDAAEYYDKKLGLHHEGVHHLYIVESDIELPYCYYPVALHRQPVFSDSPSLPVVESKEGRTFALPLFPYITRAEQDEVVRGVREVVLR